MADTASPPSTARSPAADQPERHGLDDATDQTTTETSTETAQRGQLTIADRVVERVAAQATREIHGVVAVGSALEGAVGRRYPKVDAEVAGGRVRISIEIAALWPISLTTTTAAVRTTVTERVHGLVGLHVDSVDVHAAKVVLDDGSRPARRVE